MRGVRVLYEDDHVEYVPLADPFAASEHVAAHGHVVSATLAEREDNPDVEDRNLGRSSNRLERSVAA